MKIVKNMRSFLFTTQLHLCSFVSSFNNNSSLTLKSKFGSSSGLTDVTPAPNNGTEGSLYHILRNAPTEIPDSGASQDYETCGYPQTDDEYEQIANDTDCSCELSWVSIDSWCFVHNIIKV